MAKRVYLAESDGKTFSSKADAESHDEKVFAEKKNEGFLEKFAIFLSETDLTMEYGEAEAAAISELLVAIRDNPISFMEVMEVVLPKQWSRKLKSRRGSSAPPTIAPKKKAPTKKAPTKLKAGAKSTKEKPMTHVDNKVGEEQAKENPTIVDVERLRSTEEMTEESPTAAPEETPRYIAEERENGAWSILDNGKELYDEFHGFDMGTALQATGILNAGMGRDGWDSGVEDADLLQDRLLAEGWVAPTAATPPAPPEEELTPPPPPEDVLTPLPEMPEDGDWRSEDDESPIPPMD